MNEPSQMLDEDSQRTIDRVAAICNCPDDGSALPLAVALLSDLLDMEDGTELLRRLGERYDVDVVGALLVHLHEAGVSAMVAAQRADDAGDESSALRRNGQGFHALSNVARESRVSLGTKPRTLLWVAEVVASLCVVAIAEGVDLPLPPDSAEPFPAIADRFVQKVGGLLPIEE